MKNEPEIQAVAEALAQQHEEQEKAIASLLGDKSRKAHNKAFLWAERNGYEACAMKLLPTVQKHVNLLFTCLEFARTQQPSKERDDLIAELEKELLP